MFTGVFSFFMLNFERQRWFKGDLENSFASDFNHLVLHELYCFAPICTCLVSAETKCRSLTGYAGLKNIWPSREDSCLRYPAVSTTEAKYYTAMTMMGPLAAGNKLTALE